LKRCSYRNVFAIFGLVGFALWTAGCAHDPPAPPKGKPPAINLGPELELASFKTSTDHTAVLLDSAGSAHVFVAAASKREVQHVTVSPDGGVQRELVSADCAPASISAAFDSAGRIHLLMDTTHLVREVSGWKLDAYTPWDAAGIKAHKARLVQYRDGLVWAFIVDGREVGASGRWDWYVIGGAFAAVVVPWHSGSDKLVIVSPAAESASAWYVIDPQDNLDVDNALFAADDHGNLNVVYSAAQVTLARLEQTRQALVPLANITPQQASMPADKLRSTTLSPVNGTPLLAPRSTNTLNQAAVAVDPESGLLLLVIAHQAATTFADGAWSRAFRLPLSSFWEPSLAAAGNDAFHLLTVVDGQVLYLLFAQNDWSAAVELGQTGAATIFGAIWDALGIASNGRNRAFAVWPTERGLAGRWIEGSGEIKARSRAVGIDLGHGIVLPPTLIDFAHGRATLVEPRFFEGEDPALSAIDHTRVAMQLHDTGQWVSLALLVYNDNYGDDVRWYFLGRAAEGMALCDAAEIYYAQSRVRSELFWLGGDRAGLQFPQVLDDRLASIRAMRSDGQCVTLPTPPSQTTDAHHWDQ